MTAAPQTAPGPAAPSGSAAMALPPELTGKHWRRAARELAAKMLAELSFEEALRPEPAGEGRWTVRLDGGDGGPVAYSFAARRTSLDGWRLEYGSVLRHAAGGAAPAEDPFALLADLAAHWRMDPAVTALTVTELSATLSADAHLLATGPDAARLADLPYAELEGYQTGHPWIFANKGRVGFSAADRRRYAPEARRLMPLPWIAVHPDLADYHAVEGLDMAALRAAELGEGHRSRFGAALREGLARAGATGADPERYVWLPVHPWQWDEVVVPHFAAELAGGRIVPLGEAADRYLPQQSIRTFTNMDRPDRLNVKLSLSILNTMVYRGIPTELARAAPRSTAWVHALRDRDPFLAEECRIVLPGEVAAVAVRHPSLEAIPGAPYRYRQLLGALWREPVDRLLDPGERARTFAALLHVDPAGRALAAELVRRSGLTGEEWLDRLFGAVLPPLLHLLYRYGLAFNPHGENAIVVYDERDVPVRLAVKDFVDDMKLLDTDIDAYADLPPEALAVLMRFGAPELTASLVKSLLTGHFRYLAPLAAEQLGVPEARFWELVRGRVLGYQARFPELAGRFALFDLLGPDFERVCLNRERLLGGGYHDRAERDAEFHLDASRVPNPLHVPTEEER
ncbi:IucA/IucC family protein [Allonocardiopsis opalescens]|uniref:Siderophore synthetase component n=1 Tax=Allonocardiopsis opalescens TaxID=1144618 RepID=A0A2T0QE39_9ACTN|nr:IucA/IucC family siderophore biosynthesis protein [Allonocardiopsis opalescens]PRY02175.1 siderophore synthetase component [Allonocardiopsis opalescens]